MATTFKSNEYANQTTINRTSLPGRMRTGWFEGVTTTADTGVIKFIKLPPGKVRVLPRLSMFFCANMAATANITIGTAAYTASNGAAVAASNAALKAEALVNTCTTANAITIMDIPANGCLLLESLDGVDIQATIATANTVVNAIYSGYITYIC